MGMPSMPELLVILAIVVLLFGAKKIPRFSTKGHRSTGGLHGIFHTQRLFNRWIDDEGSSRHKEPNRYLQKHKRTMVRSIHQEPKHRPTTNQISLQLYTNQIPHSGFYLYGVNNGPIQIHKLKVLT